MIEVEQGWTISSAQKLIAGLRQPLGRLGYTAAIGGSLSFQLTSKRDLDLYLIPAHGCTEMPDRLVEYLTDLWGHPTNLIAASGALAGAKWVGKYVAVMSTSDTLDPDPTPAAQSDQPVTKTIYLNSLRFTRPDGVIDVFVLGSMIPVPDRNRFVSSSASVPADSAKFGSAGADSVDYSMPFRNNDEAGPRRGGARYGGAVVAAAPRPRANQWLEPADAHIPPAPAQPVCSVDFEGRYNVNAREQWRGPHNTDSFVAGCLDREDIQWLANQIGWTIENTLTELGNISRIGDVGAYLQIVNRQPHRARGAR